MSRAWPFENKPEGGKRAARSDTPEGFIQTNVEGADAVVLRIGANDALLVLVDKEGAWDHWVYHSKEEALQVANSLRVEVHEDEYPEALRVRMNARRRPASEFESGAYPEQGPVGPVIPYPENRPRQADLQTADEATPEEPAEAQ